MPVAHRKGAASAEPILPIASNNNNNNNNNSNNNNKSNNKEDHINNKYSKSNNIINYITTTNTRRRRRRRLLINNFFFCSSPQKYIKITTGGGLIIILLLNTLIYIIGCSIYIIIIRDLSSSSSLSPASSSSQQQQCVRFQRTRRVHALKSLKYYNTSLVSAATSKQRHHLSSSFEGRRWVVVERSQKMRSELYHLGFFLLKSILRISNNNDLLSVLLIAPRSSNKNDVSFVERMEGLHNVTTLTTFDMYDKAIGDDESCYDHILVMEDFDALIRGFSLREITGFVNKLQSRRCDGSSSLQISLSHLPTLLFLGEILYDDDDYLVVLQDTSNCFAGKHCGFTVISHRYADVDDNNNDEDSMIQSSSSKLEALWVSDESTVSLFFLLYESHLQDVVVKEEEKFTYLDAPTIKSLELPPKIFENFYCSMGNHQECKTVGYFSGFNRIYASSAFEVKQSSLTDVGRGVFALENIRPDSILFTDSPQLVYFSSYSSGIMDGMLEMNKSPLVKSMNDVLTNFIWGYGTSHDDHGAGTHIVNTGISMFVNHGCNHNMINVGDVEEAFYDDSTELKQTSEVNANPDVYSEELSWVMDYFSPVLKRWSFVIKANRAAFSRRWIYQGEEILANTCFTLAKKSREKML